MKKTLEVIELSSLVPYGNNPRINDHAVGDVIESIKQCENLDPIEIDENNVILAGHTRLKALEELGYKETEVIRYTGLTEEQKRKYRILSNKTGEKAQWDLSKLEEELNNLDFDDYDFGFDDFGESEEDIEIIEDEIPEEATESRANNGDMFQLGPHRLICGDSTDPDVIKRLMDGNNADLLITDPPYNVNYSGVAGTIENDNMEDHAFREFLTKAFSAADSVMRDGACFYIWHADSEGYNFRGACRDIGWKIRECLIWVKNSLVLGRQDYQWRHEPCLYGWRDGASHTWTSDRKQTTVINYERPIKSELHPTMKPVGLFAYQIKNNTHKGDRVLDIFGGSGTTIMACQQLDRKAYVVELDEKYCDVILERWETATGEKAVKIDE